jgi:FkbM family methyltransferase
MTYQSQAHHLAFFYVDNYPPELAIIEFAMAFADPIKNLNQLNLHDGLVVADIGAGSGHYTLEAARRVAPGGKVFAIDIQQDLLARIKNDAHKHTIKNVEVIHGNIEQKGGMKLKEESIDVAIVSNVLFQAESKEAAIAEIYRIMKPGGKVMLVEWSDTVSGIGPGKNQIIPEAETKALFEAHQFSHAGTFNPGDHHYGLLFKVL